MNKPISSLFVFSVVYCVVFRQKLKTTRRKEKNKQKETNIKQKSFEKNIKTLQTKQKYSISSPRTSANKYMIYIYIYIYIYIFAEVRGLDILYCCFSVVFSRSCLCFMSASFCCVFCFRLVYLSFCIYNRKRHENIKTNMKSFEKNIKT